MAPNGRKATSSWGHALKIDSFGTEKGKSRKQKEMRQSYAGEPSLLVERPSGNEAGGPGRLGENRTGVGRGVASAGRTSKG